MGLLGSIKSFAIGSVEAFVTYMSVLFGGTLLYLPPEPPSTQAERLN